MSVTILLKQPIQLVDKIATLTEMKHSVLMRKQKIWRYSTQVH